MKECYINTVSLLFAILARQGKLVLGYDDDNDDDDDDDEDDYGAP